MLDLKEIEKYIIELLDDEENFKNQSLKQVPNEIRTKRRGLWHYLRQSGFLLLSLLDYICLYCVVKFNRDYLKDKRFVYTGKNFCINNDGVLEDRIVKPLFTQRIIFINQSKEYHLTKVNSQKVYNLGGVVKLIALLNPSGSTRLIRLFGAYRSVNDSIIRHLNESEVYMLWFYDLNSLSLIFSRFRDRIRLIEVQHGSIINYPPYAKPAPIKIADLFYVKNQATADYLKTHLCANFSSSYKLIPYPDVKRENVPGLHILYASTVEFNGLHPVFKDFLRRNTINDLHVIIRLHPRERHKEKSFAEELSGFHIRVEFDNSINWLEGNRIKNLIVISPWSSSLEDAYDNGFITIVIDPVGKERYKHLLDKDRFFYSDDLVASLLKIKENTTA